ncbi:Cation/H(+) antiporter like [Melia azedarach]|uniref:Cation/H(+) antiporter like n=2 Tax=Melia azedarach TaxID=155640 RepID=A0ACC1X118_MELAZ|nr:Cation/H(+) antiporter like [Melia azedarach]KAJ4704714.1 Cation/H(+) antiporter like [Melia azedarach]
MVPLNITNIKTSSDGAWQGDNPLNSAFPLLIVQTTLVLFTSRFLAFLIKPLRQPRVVAEIVGGILLGPSALGRNKEFLHVVFPPWSTPILESVSSIGLLFFLFLVGLELDLSSMRQNSKSAFKIALAGITLPFLFGAGVSFFLQKSVHGEYKVGYFQFLVFIGVAVSITAFPVLARILADLKLLTTPMGQTAMAAAAFNDVAAWILLALAVALAGNGSGEAHKSSLIPIWVLISGVAFVAFMLIVVRPIMNWVACQCSSEQGLVDDFYICLTLAGVMLSGFMTDLIGIHSIFGAFVFGLTIPKGGEFAERLMKKIQDFVSGLLLPLYFASSGLKTDVAKIRGIEAWGLLVLVISTACAGKILGTFVMAMLCMIPVRESLALGVLMNTKGLVELIVLNIGREKKVLNDEMFAILVLMALFTTFMTTPAVLVIYKPLRRVTSRRLAQQSPAAKNTEDEFRIQACIHGPENVPSLINLIEVFRTTKKSQLKLYVMHLLEFTERSSSILMVQKARKNGLPFTNRFCRGMSQDETVAAFQAYNQLGRVSIRHSTAISSLSTIHEDIFHVTEEKRIGLIILPFHKKWRGVLGEDVIDSVCHGWRDVNLTVLQTAPCSVAVLVDRGFGCGSDRTVAESSASVLKRVCIIFFGGPDDRKALELGRRMEENAAVRVTLVRFIENVRAETSTIVERAVPDICTVSDNYSIGQEPDEIAVEEFKRNWNGSMEYEERMTSNIKHEILMIGQSREYELLVVGKGSFPSFAEAKLSDHQAENVGLGPIGNILASSDNGILISVLIIQQQNAADGNEANSSKMVSDKDSWSEDLA